MMSTPPHTATSSAEQPAQPTMPNWLMIFLAIACGVIVANLYYAQPLVGLIRADIGLSAEAAGLIVTLAQIGYAVGLLFIVPLGDIVENRRLVFVSLLFTVLALLMAAWAGQATIFLIASMLIGLGSVAAQILVPYASHLAPEQSRGRVVGNIMSGLLLGIMLARPLSSLIADHLGWRAVFFISAALVLILALVLIRALPTNRPASRHRYPQLIASMAQLVRHTPILRRRALYHAAIFGTFSLFWTTVPLLLAGPIFHFSQTGIAIFALVGVAGAAAAPIAGRMADRGWIRPGTAMAFAVVIISMLLPLLARDGSIGSVLLLVLAAILLDLGVSANLVLGQRAIFSLGAEVRSRLNGLYMATFFLGGAIGSSAGTWAFEAGGWPAAIALGLALPLLALVYFVTEFRRNPVESSAK
ncbi:MFS transporter [Paenibacillus hunanensis]|uniref:MFS transporter n=1 Tax=Paenibacillus hunanensis TaxID=539262 RepID=UPI002026458B|nr:MFS transporter [Paenibacillus hunanensis]MCL9659685.1 MFS transporter [Paenibacillus hunanensis]